MGNKEKDIINKKFGKLTITGFHIVDKYHRKLWKCSCECGNTCIARLNELKSGKKQTCGNRAKHWSGFNSAVWQGVGQIGLKKLNNYKRQAKSRKIEFNISLDYIWNLYLKQNKKCALSGIDIGFENSKNLTASLDRIDSSKGYVENNVQWVHKMVNFMKQDYNQNEFIEMCKKITKFNKPPIPEID